MRIAVCIKPSYYGVIGEMRSDRRGDMPIRAATLSQMDDWLQAGTWRLARGLEPDFFNMGFINIAEFVSKFD